MLFFLEKIVNFAKLSHAIPQLPTEDIEKTAPFRDQTWLSIYQLSVTALRSTSGKHPQKKVPKNMEV
jgi:hypothetical protein